MSHTFRTSPLQFDGISGCDGGSNLSGSGYGNFFGGVNGRYYDVVITIGSSIGSG